MSSISQPKSNELQSVLPCKAFIEGQSHVCRPDNTSQSEVNIAKAKLPCSGNFKTGKGCLAVLHKTIRCSTVKLHLCFMKSHLLPNSPMGCTAGGGT